MNPSNIKGLICGIYTSKELPDCSNGGISGKVKSVVVLMDAPEAQVFEPREGLPAVKIVRRNIFGREYIHAEPIEQPGENTIGRYMAGGAFIFSCDSRFSRLISSYPIALHDRTETPEQYDILSR